MDERAAHGLWVIVASIAMALLLMILAVPDWLRWSRPEWVTMVLIYWVMALPHRVGILVGASTGLLLDVLEGAVLGEHAFALVIVAYATMLLYQRLRMFAVWQQAFIVYVLVGIQQLACHWVENIAGNPEQNLLFLLPALMSAVFWPLVTVCLSFFQRMYAVY